MAALQAYEELTCKETLCLREENFDALLATQAKKARLLDGLAQLAETPFKAGEAEQFKAKISALQRQEAENAAVLEEKMRVNREQHKALSRSAKSSVSALRAYGRPDPQPPAASSTLKDKA